MSSWSRSSDPDMPLLLLGFPSFSWSPLLGLLSERGWPQLSGQTLCAARLGIHCVKYFVLFKILLPAKEWTSRHCVPNWPVLYHGPGPCLQSAPPWVRGAYWCWCCSVAGEPLSRLSSSCPVVSLSRCGFGSSCLFMEPVAVWAQSCVAVLRLAWFTTSA